MSRENSPSRRTFLATTAAASLAAAGIQAQPRPRNRPNIVVIMADDMGYSDLGCYGGEIATPNLDRLARRGLRFTQFYNNAKCAPTRASLLTGLYSQQTGCRTGPERMRNCVTLAEAARKGGYHTMMTGKWHAEELPTERGFDRYFGLCDGCCNFWNPGEQRKGEPKPAEKNYPRKWSRDGEVMRPYTPESGDFYTTDAFTDAALAYLGEAPARDNPFFLYVAYTAPHYPLHAWPEDIAKYRGKYRRGWDVLRQERHARQKSMGLLDPKWPLAPRDPRVPAWEDVEDRDAWDLDAMGGGKRYGLKWEDASDRDAWDHKMAVYAAMVDRMDQNIGRIVDQLDAMGELENTLIMFLSDNGGCAEVRHATPGVAPGPVNSYRTVDPPWANAQNTPFRKYKRWDHEGGIATPFIAHWPGQIEAGRMVHDPAHITDLMPTLLELAGVEYPAAHRGDRLPPLEGQSLAPVLRGEALHARGPIFWQFLRARGMRQGKWKLADAGQGWELYDMEQDRTELNDLAPTQPGRVGAMAAAWDAWAKRCNAHVPEEEG